MMNRSLMGRQMFAKGGEAKSFPDYSGDGQITQKDILMGRGVLPMQEGGTVPMDPMMADPMMADPMMADPMMDPSSGFTPENNPEAVQNAMMAAAENFGNLDDADDYESMINMIRGDQAPMAERVNELAELVGLEDAQQTPQSVVALIQPVMLMTNLDEGIGSIAQGAMDQEMTGDMAGGIMSTVNMDSGPEMSLDPNMDPQMGMGVGNEPPVNFRFGGPVARMQDGGESRLSQLFAEQQGVLNQNFAPRSGVDADLERQKELTEAQMLFDVAGTALAFATPGSRQMSPAQRLAEAATETKLFDKLGARAQGQFEAEKASKEALRSEKRDLDLLAFKGAQDQLDRELQMTPAKLFDFKVVDGQIVKTNNKTGGVSLAFTGRDKIDFLTMGDNILAANPISGNVEVAFTDTSPNLKVLSKGQQIIDADTAEVIYTAPENAQLEKMGNFLVDTTNRTPDGNATVIFEAPDYEVDEINGQLVQYKKGDPDSAVAIFGEEGIDIDPVYMVQTDMNTGVKTTFDATTPNGAAMLKNANQANQQAGSTVFTIGKLSSDKTPSAQAFNLGSEIVLSFDGGRTYVNSLGVTTAMPTTGAVPVSDTIASEVMKNQRISQRAGEESNAFYDRFYEEQGYEAEDRKLFRDTAKAAMNGTGFAAKLRSAVDKTLGQLGVDYGEETEADKQYLRAIRQMTKTALIVNPRFPVAELSKVEDLYPDVDSFFVSPDSQVNRLRELKRVVLAQKEHNLTKLAGGALSADDNAKVLANNQEISRLLMYIGPLGVGSTSYGGNKEEMEASFKKLQEKVRN